MRTPVLLLLLQSHVVGGDGLQPVNRGGMGR